MPAPKQLSFCRTCSGQPVRFVPAGSGDKPVQCHANDPAREPCDDCGAVPCDGDCGAMVVPDALSTFELEGERYCDRCAHALVLAFTPARPSFTEAPSCS